MKKWWIAYLQKNQNIIALSVSVLAGLILAGMLFLSPCPTVLDQGEYDLLLPKLGLRYTPQELESQPRHYGYRGVEEFLPEEIPSGSLILQKPEPSLVYPASLVSVFCKVLGIPFSTRYLACVLCLLLLWAIYILLKALYVWIGNNALFVGLAACVVLLCGDYTILFNSLYTAGMFFVSFWLLAAALLRGFALCRTGGYSRFRILYPAVLASVLFLTSNEQAALLWPVVAGMCVVLMLACGTKDKVRMRVECGALTVALVLLSTVFLHRQEIEFNTVNLYDSFFDGVLVFAGDPEKALDEFGMEPGLIRDKGKTYYEAENSFYLAPGTKEAEERIFSHLGYSKITVWYLTHPGSMFRGISHQLQNAKDNWRQMFIYSGDTVEDENPVTRYDWWSALRMLIPRNIVLWGLLCAAVLVMGVWMIRKGDPSGWLLAGLTVAQGVLLLLSIVVSGEVHGGRNLSLFAYLSDFTLILAAERVIRAGQKGIYYVLHPEGGARGTAPYPDQAESYYPDPMPCLLRFRKEAGRRCAGLWERMKEESFFVRTVTVVAAVVMILVLFVPRIGAYNNGDFGRMMDAMQLTYTPEDFYHPEEQYSTKIIEDYLFLEPYDWSMIRPSRTMLSQAYVSAFARILYEITGLPFSTVTITVLYTALLVLAFRQFMRSAYRFWGRKALAAAAGYVLLFFGSYNLGWLNSLFGEGVGFVGLMLVAASSMNLLERPKGSPGAGWLYYVGAVALFVGAKAQYVVSLPILAVWSGVLLLYHLPKKKLSRYIVLCGSAAVVLAVVGMGIHVYKENDKISSQDTLVQGLYNGILVVADDPEAALEELGLDKRLAADKGKNAYEDPETYFCAPRTEMAEKMIYSKVSTIDYLFWYMRHPVKLIQVLDAAARASADPMPDYFLYVTDRVQNPDRRTVHKLAFWQDMRPGVTPRYFGIYVVAFGAIFLTCFLKLKDRNLDVKRKGYIGLFLVFMLCGIFQYPLTVIGNGFSDNIKQIYLFREVWDGTVLVTLVWLGINGYQKVLPGLCHRKQKSDR